MIVLVLIQMYILFVIKKRWIGRYGLSAEQGLSSHRIKQHHIKYHNVDTLCCLVLGRKRETAVNKERCKGLSFMA